jgi:hypothetical protein
VTTVHETDSQSRYDMIFRQDLQQDMVMDILFLSQQLRWDSIEAPMQTLNSNLIDLDKINSTNKNNIDVSADLDVYLKLVNHLDSNQKSSLKLTSNKFKNLFDGLLGDWKTDPVDLRLKSGEMPFP